MNRETMPVGRRHLDNLAATSNSESECDDALLAACGVDPHKPDEWPLGDIWFDDYDASFEFGGVRPGWEPTAEQLNACMALGFERCWLNYTDGAETYYSPTHGFSRKTAEQKQARPRTNTDHLRTVRRLQADRRRLDWIEEQLAMNAPLPEFVSAEYDGPYCTAGSGFQYGSGGGASLRTAIDYAIAIAATEPIAAQRGGGDGR